MFLNQITEGLRDPKDNPCWKGYHPVGTKKKNSRTVPNCVPESQDGVNEGAYEDGVSDGIRGEPNRRASSIYGPSTGEYDRGYQVGLQKGKEQQQARLAQAQQDLAPYEKMSDEELIQLRKEIQQRSTERQKIYSKLRGADFSFDPKRHLPANDAELKAQHAKDNKAWHIINQVLQQRGVNINKLGESEGSKFGSIYAEQLAQQIFDIKPDLKNENEVLNLGYSIAVRELGPRARGFFRDEDFPSDFVSAYGWLQDQRQQGVAEGSEDIGSKILDLCNKIYSLGDDAVDHVYHNAPTFAKAWDKYEGDLDSIVQEVSPKILQRIYAELLPLAQEEGVAEAFIAPALSAANANAEHRRRGAAGGGYRGRIDIPVQSREDYISAGRALKKAAAAAGQKIEYGLSNGVMSVFSDSMDSDTLDQFIDSVLGQGVAEGFPHDVDHMPGPTIKNPQTGCQRCHGKGYVYKTADGKVLPSNEQGAKRYKCGACGGIGFVKQGVAEGADDNILDEAAPWVDKLGLGNFFRKIQNVDANSQNEIRILSGLNHSMQLYFKTILALNAQAGPAASLFWPLLGKQALLFAGGAAAYTIGKILATKLGRALFGSTEEALAWAQAHLAAGKNKESKFEFDGKQYPVTVVDPASIANLEQQIAQLEGIIANKQNRAAKAEYQKSLRQPKKVYQGVTEMDTQQPKGRIKSDGTRSHSTYGSRDHYSDADPQHVAKPTKAEKMMKHAHDVMMKSMSTADKVEKGWRNPDIDEGSEEQVYKVVALDKGNALKKPTKLNVKASSIEDVFSRLAANDWYALSINGVEVVAGKRLKQGVAEADQLPGTPVVSLKDLGDEDNKKNRYGQTVPKKLKKDDPRVKFHKEPEQKEIDEGDYDIRRDPTYQKYDPETHTMMYKDGKHKAVKHDQVAKARALGWKVRSSLKAFAKGQGGVAEGDRDPGALASRAHIASQERKHQAWDEKQKQLEKEFYANHPELNDRHKSVDNLVKEFSEMLSRTK